MPPACAGRSAAANGPVSARQQYPTARAGRIDLSRTDPAFALVAASLADPLERGFSRPLLLTREEVVMAREGGDPVLQSLRERAAPDPVQALVPRR